MFAKVRRFPDSILSERTVEWFCNAARSAAEVACLVWPFVCSQLALQPVSYVGQQQVGQLVQMGSKMYKRFQVITAVAIDL